MISPEPKFYFNSRILAITEAKVVITIGLLLPSIVSACQDLQQKPSVVTLDGVGSSIPFSQVSLVSANTAPHS